jgi:hypothetical protein
MSSDILARLVAVQAELAKIIVELTGPSTPQKSIVSSVPIAPVKARRPKITTEVLEEVKTSGGEAVKAINDTESENSEKTKKKRVISEERLTYLKSPEHIAKLKAGKEARKARKNAEKHAEELVKSLDNSYDKEDGELSE